MNYADALSLVRSLTYEENVLLHQLLQALADENKGPSVLCGNGRAFLQGLLCGNHLASIIQPTAAALQSRCVYTGRSSHGVQSCRCFNAASSTSLVNDD